MEFHKFDTTMDEQLEGEPWASDSKLFEPLPEYIFLHEKANCISVEAFLKMCGLGFEIEYRPNAEYMSPTGEVPFIKCGNSIVAGMEGIVDFVKSKNIQLHSQSHERESDMKAHMNHFNNVLTNAELYFVWCHEKIIHEYTYPRYISKYPWPLNMILYYNKKRNTTKKLKSEAEPMTSYGDVLKYVEDYLRELSDVMTGPYFFGKTPTEFDALIFGHLSAIQTTALPDDALSIIVRENEPLVTLCNRIGSEYYPGLITTKQISHSGL